MKPVLELLAASTLSVGMVIGGVVVASAALAPEAEQQHHFAGLDIRDLWTAKPVRIDREAQDLERLPPRYASHVVMSEPTGTTNDVALESGMENLVSRVADIDIMATSAVNDASDGFAGETMSPQHVSWCSSKYRSYDPIDNTYRSFSGLVHDCTSPFESDVTTDIQVGDAELMTVSNEASGSSAQSFQSHSIAICMERYRSYRVSDNTYQPYGGGPRKQCQLASF